MHWLNPGPQGNNLLAVHMSTREEGIAVGEGGAILTTRDGGNTWIGRFASHNGWLTATHSLQGGTAWAVGENGTAVGTRDGGNSWILRNLPSQYLVSVFFLDSLNGWTTGDPGVIFRTRDGGDTWVRQYFGWGRRFIDLRFTSLDTGFLRDESGQLLRTSDGGGTWIAYTPDLPGMFNILSIHFVHASLGYAIANRYRIDNRPYGVFLKTIDGGVTWEQQIVSDTGFLEARDIRFLDSAQGYVLLRNGEFWKTSDGGSTWRRGNMQLDLASIAAVSFADSQIGWAVGATGQIFKSEDGWVTWNRQTDLITGEDLNALSFPDSNIGYVVGKSGTVLKTEDGGHTWRHLPTAGNGRHLLGIHFLDPLEGYAVGERGTLLKTADGGLTWEPHPTDDRDLRSIHCPVASTCHAVGFYSISGSFALSTTDAGKTWTSRNFSQNESHAIRFLDSRNGVVVGHGIWNTKNGGQTWSQNPGGQSGTIFRTLRFLDHRLGFAAGGNYYTLAFSKTSDGGSTWREAEFPYLDWMHRNNEPGIFDFRLFRDGVGYGVGGGAILKTLDGGTTFTAQYARTKNSLRALHCPTSKSCIAVGARGAILKIDFP